MASGLSSKDGDQTSHTLQRPADFSRTATQSDARFAPGTPASINPNIFTPEAFCQHTSPSQGAPTGINPTLAGLAEASRAPKRLADEECDISRAHKRYLSGPSRFVEHTKLNIPSLPNGFIGKYSKLPHTITGGPFTLRDKILPCSSNFDFISSLCTSRELIITVCHHVKPRDVLSLMKASKAFYKLFMASFRSNVWQLANGMAPGAARTFYWKFYPALLIRDPTGVLPNNTNLRHVFPWTKSQPGAEANPLPRDPEELQALKNLGLLDAKPRMVPGLQWLNMIVERERRVRDIVACLARSGHRVPRHAHISLKKMWLLMDCAHNAARQVLIGSRQLFSDFDLYNLQLFFIKLQMRFNEPIFGPDSSELSHVLLGQKTGLDVMWAMLRRKKYHDDLDASRQLKVRYNYELTTAEFMANQPIHNVPLLEVGIGNLEGWGLGMHHLKRPDELVIEEAANRGLQLSVHYLNMAVWGHIDIKKKKNLVPTEEEMYMSDDELPPMHPKHPDACCGNVPFHPDEWLPKHAKKARWNTLTRAEKLQIKADDVDEQLRDLVWEVLPSDDEYDDDIYGGDFDMVPKDTVRSSTWQTAPESTTAQKCFKKVLKQSNYSQSQQDGEMSGLAGVAEEQSKTEMDFDGYIDNMDSTHTKDVMDIDKDSNGVDMGKTGAQWNGGEEGAAADEGEEDIEPPQYDFRKF